MNSISIILYLRSIVNNEFFYLSVLLTLKSTAEKVELMNDFSNSQMVTKVSKRPCSKDRNKNYLVQNISVDCSRHQRWM